MNRKTKKTKMKLQISRVNKPKKNRKGAKKESDEEPRRELNRL